MSRAKTDAADRLFARMREASDPSPNGYLGCWLWQGWCDSYGYGRIMDWRDGRKVTRLTHVVAWEYIVGMVPPKRELDHLCRRPTCCNPAHLEPVTHRENMRRGMPGGKGKTHCHRGHPLSGSNVRITVEGWRRCLTCEQMANKRRDERVRERAAAAVGGVRA